MSAVLRDIGPVGTGTQPMTGDTTWLCPRGHEITAADRYDLWCDTCNSDVTAFAVQPSDPPEYEPDLDDLAAARERALETP